MVASASLPNLVEVVISRRGHPDFASSLELVRVRAAPLLILGEMDGYNGYEIKKRSEIS